MFIFSSDNDLRKQFAFAQCKLTLKTVLVDVKKLCVRKNCICFQHMITSRFFHLSMGLFLFYVMPTLQRAFARVFFICSLTDLWMSFSRAVPPLILQIEYIESTIIRVVHTEQLLLLFYHNR